jgi:hypothetical protein
MYSIDSWALSSAKPFPLFHWSLVFHSRPASKLRDAQFIRTKPAQQTASASRYKCMKNCK